MKRLSILFISLFALAALSGCANRKIVIVNTDQPAPPAAKNKGQAIASQKHLDNGLKQLNKGHYKQASDQFRLAIDKDPSNWEAHYYLGLTFQRWKRYRESTDYFLVAIDLNPRDKVWVSKVRLHLGITLEYQGRYRDAEREYQLSMSLNPRNTEASERWERVSKKNKHKSNERYKKDKDDQDDDRDNDHKG
ncbi:MAG: hypothetical protein A2142_05855 [candidate division Zixibacteria bacterium RBG_16_48_11]|nr:MAG: hypothetical protein A2142_05855 [candidate division Zixibacteria bacterium RBG_16_48_11]